MHQPILVTGSHRSGTTWVGQMLCLSGELGYVYEPFRPRMYERPGWMVEKFPYWFQYIGPENEQEYIERVTNLLRLKMPFWGQWKDVHNSRHFFRLVGNWFSGMQYRLRGMGPLLKDPFAVFLAEWLAQRFGVQVVVMIRHPAAFASSVKRLNWTFGFHQFQEQPDLIRRYVPAYAEQIEQFVKHPPDIIDTAILQWNLIYSTVYQHQQKHPDWVFLRHEDLAEEPLVGFERLYQQLGLRWSERVQKKIAAYASAENEKHGLAEGWNTIRQDSHAARWRWATLLKPEEVARVREGTQDVGALFYDQADWTPPQK